jgi:hypothetical protein
LTLHTKELYVFGCFEGILQKAKLALLLFYGVALTRFCIIASFLYHFSISSENFYLVEKQNNENFVKKDRRFVGSGFVKTCDEQVKYREKVFEIIRTVRGQNNFF